MQVIEVVQNVEVETPKGRGRIWLVTDYGLDIEKIFTVILYNGEFWEFRNSQIKATSNLTAGRLSK